MARQTKPVTPPSLPTPPVNRLAGKIQAVIEYAFAHVLDGARDTLVDVLSAGLELFLDVLKPVLLRAYRPLLEHIRDTEGMPTEVRTLLNTALTAEGEGGSALLMSLGTQAGGAIVGSVLNSLLAPVTDYVNRQTRPARLDPTTALALAWRGGWDWPVIFHHTADQGYEDSDVKAMANTIRPRADVGALLAAWFRDEIPESAFNDELNKRGYHPDDITIIKRISRMIPGPADLVRMAVREAFTPATVAKYGYGQDWPEAFGEWMKKQGDLDDWARKYWYAHWELPSITMAMEMLHRTVDDVGNTVINSETFRDLLKIADIAPYWRDKIEAISYSVPTRVDVRRAYKEGVIGLPQVRRIYLDLGYTAEWADILTAWTAVAYEPEEQEATKSEILGALQRGTLTESEATAALKNLDYGDEIVAFYLSQVAYKKAQKVKELQMDAIQDLYENGSIDRVEAATRLTALALPSSEIEASLELWTITRERKTKRPTKSEAESFYKAGIIDADGYQQMLDDVGIGDQYIILYVRQVDQEIAEAAAKEQERAQKEQERIAKAERATAYQQAVAEIDVQIAEQRLTVAGAQTALNATMSAAEILAADTQIAQLHAEIAAEERLVSTYRADKQAAQSTLDARLSAVLRTELETRISDAQVIIAQVNAEIAAINTEIERAQLQLLEETEEETIAAGRQYIAAQEVLRAEKREAIEAQDIIITEARAELRTYITDEERQALEAAIRKADTHVAAAQVRIAEKHQQIAAIRAQVTAALNDEQRAALMGALITARQRIAELQVQRAQARVETT